MGRPCVSPPPPCRPALPLLIRLSSLNYGRSKLKKEMATFLLLLLLLTPLLFSSTSANFQVNVVEKVTNNPADQLVALINGNRTAHKGSALYDNSGLACVALQYIKAYQGECSDPKKPPPDTEFAQTFAPNCGVSASTLAPITGRLLGCQTKYVPPSQAWSSILMKNSKSFDILYDNNHTEVGAAVTGSNGGSPYFWCVLFSNGKSNSSFAVEGGVAKITRPGCFSGANDVCSTATTHLLRHLSLWPFAAAAAAAYLFVV